MISTSLYLAGLNYIFIFFYCEDIVVFYQGDSKPFDKVVVLFGDPQAFGQPPITSMRQVGNSCSVSQYISDINKGILKKSPPGSDVARFGVNKNLQLKHILHIRVPRGV